LLVFTTILTALQKLIYLDSFVISASRSRCWLSELDVRQPALGCTYLFLYHENLLRVRVGIFNSYGFKNIDKTIYTFKKGILQSQNISSVENLPNKSFNLELELKNTLFPLLIVRNYQKLEHLTPLICPMIEVFY